MKKVFIKILTIIITSVTLTNCSIYSFSGASIPQEAKTISVKTFQNNASLVNPTLSNQLTEALKNKFQSQTNLNIVPSNGDLQFEGDIINYYTQPVAIQGNQTAAYNRLTITINVRYTNKFDEKFDYEQNFSRYADYSSTENLSSVENNIVNIINEVLVEDIFNKAFVNW